MSITPFQQKVYNVTKGIPRGKVATYGLVARAVGDPRAVRAVGNALHKNFLRSVPCHRVVRSDGKVGGYNRGSARKIKRLRKEGVVARGGTVDLRLYLNHGKTNNS